jgi:hypothetical protein
VQGSHALGVGMGVGEKEVGSIRHKNRRIMIGV